jgi:hypothetical protein
MATLIRQTRQYVSSSRNGPRPTLPGRHLSQTVTLRQEGEWEGRRSQEGVRRSQQTAKVDDLSYDEYESYEDSMHGQYTC